MGGKGIRIEANQFSEVEQPLGGESDWRWIFESHVHWPKIERQNRMLTTGHTPVQTLGAGGPKRK